MPSKAVTYIPTPMAAATNLAEDVDVCYDTAGRACVPANTTGLVYAGTTAQAVDNSAGAADALNINLIPPTDGVNRFRKVTLASAAQADCGEITYWTGPSTVSKTAGNAVVAGVVVQLVGTNTVLIDTLRTLGL